MHPKQVELIANQLRREKNAPVRDNSLRHLDAARAKLEELKEVRHRMAATLERCVNERDAAVAALNKLRDARNEQAMSIYRVQQGIIDDLRAQVEIAASALQDVSAMLEAGRFSPNIFQRASTKVQDALASLSEHSSSRQGTP
jgi:hypothetical protein